MVDLVNQSLARLAEQTANPPLVVWDESFYYMSPNGMKRFEVAPPAGHPLKILGMDWGATEPRFITATEVMNYRRGL